MAQHRKCPLPLSSSGPSPSARLDSCLLPSHICPGPSPLRSAFLRSQERLPMSSASVCSDVSRVTLGLPPGPPPLLVFPKAPRGRGGSLPCSLSALPPPGPSTFAWHSVPSCLILCLSFSRSRSYSGPPGASSPPLSGRVHHLQCRPLPPHLASSFKIQFRRHLAGDTFPRCRLD